MPIWISALPTACRNLATTLALACGIPDRGGDQPDIQLRRPQEQGQGPGVVDVVTDIRVKDHRDRLDRYTHLLGRSARHG